MWKKWKKRLSSLLIITLIASLCVPQLSVIADTADVIVGDNGTIYDIDYEPYIYDEDEWEDDEDDEDYDNYENDVMILASGSNATPSNASPSNESVASDSNWSMASDSNAALNIVEFTEPGPFLPATGGFSLWSRFRSVGTLADTDEGTDDVDGIHTSKTAIANTDGSYTIRLESYVEGTITKTNLTTPVDIVLVLDVSGSMKWCMECGTDDGYHKVDTVQNITSSGAYYYSKWGSYYQAYYYNGAWYTSETTHDNYTKLSDNVYLYEKCGESRITALKNAVSEFISSVGDYAQEYSVDHQIAIVKFAGDNKNTVGNDMYNNNTYNYSQIVKNLTDVSISDNVDVLKSINEGLKAGGATSADYGMTHAYNIINAIDESRKSQKVVIMFTDGEPNHGNDFDSKVANNTISISKNIKGLGATVYTIGVFDGADATVPMASNATDMNKYMHYVSSNFENANRPFEESGDVWWESSTEGDGTGDPEDATYPNSGSYYMSTGDSDGLSDIFDNISSQIQSGGASIELSTDTIVNDVVTPYFDLPANTSAIKVYTAECTGTKDSYGNYVFADELSNITSSVTVSMDKTTNAVSVTGFDYSKNFVASTGRVYGDTSTSGDFYGRKLIIEFKITPKEGFLGGNNVPTNVEATISSSESGISKTFEDEPIVNVPIPGFTVTAVDKNVYLTNTLTLDELTAGAQVITTDNGATIKFDPNEDNYGLEDWQNAFVNIVPESELVDSGETIPLVEDDTYGLSVTISPNDVASSTNGAVAKETTATGEGSIDVYLPQLTYTDGEVYYGAAVPDATYLDTLKAKNIIWKHGDTLSTKVSMIGDEPKNFAFTYQPTAGTSLVKNNTVVSLSDIPVSVQTVTIGNSGNLIEKVSFIRNNCSGNDKCPVGLDGKGHFLLHVKSCDLTITKTGGASDETYIFYVDSPENAVENMKMTIRITGNDSITIRDLPVGTYTVTEDKSWSWRYSSSWEDGKNEAKLELKSTKPNGSVTCINTKKNDQWLNHLSTVWKNVFGESTGREVSGNE